MFAKVESVLSGRFVPAIDASRSYKKNERPFTLYSALMESLGLGFGDSVLSARNHDAIVAAVRHFYAALDSVTGERSQVWAMRPSRTEDEIVAALRAAAGQFAPTDFDGLVADLRVGLGKVAGRGKFRGAVAVEATRVACLERRPFVDVLEALFGREVPDAEALSCLESVPGDIDVADADWSPAISFANAYGEFLANDPDDMSLWSYWHWLRASSPIVSDQALSARTAVAGPRTQVPA